jgi:hypothetical protein
VAVAEDFTESEELPAAPGTSVNELGEREPVHPAGRELVREKVV